uniref:Uncharacterized protein n=1 Tax=Papio anubis TaxID=9555 RepID=A0A8I5R890_PAPAN
MGPRRAPELYRAPFPLLGLQVDPSTGLLIAAGGGGAAKAGIKNGHTLLLSGLQVWAGSRPACWAVTLHSANSPQAPALARSLLPHSLGWLQLLAPSHQVLWP